jgi:hypothetical protein
MVDFASIIQKTKKPLAVCAVLILIFTTYLVDRSNTHLVIIKPKQGRTLEEIMQTPVEATAESAWDTEFKSEIIPIEDK